MRRRPQRAAKAGEQVRVLLAGNPGARLPQIRSEVVLSHAPARREIEKDPRLKSLKQVAAYHAGRSRKQTRQGRCGERPEGMDRSHDLDPRTAFWAEKEIFRLGHQAGGNQNWRAWARELAARGDAPLGPIRLEDGALQGRALAVCCLGASWRGMGAPRFASRGGRLGAEECMGWLEGPYDLEGAAQIGGKPAIFFLCVLRIGARSTFRRPGIRGHGRRVLRILSPLAYTSRAWLESAWQTKAPIDVLTLKEAVAKAAADLTSGMNRRATDGWYARVALCVQAGDIFGSCVA